MMNVSTLKVNISKLLFVVLTLSVGLLSTTSQTAQGSCFSSFSKCLTSYFSSLKSCFSNINEELISSIKSGDIKRVHELLQQKANVNYQDGEGVTPLMWAIDKDRIDIVDLLLKTSGINIALINRENITALGLAVLHGNCDIIKLFGKAGVDINEQCTTERGTPLMGAIWFDNIAMVQQLLSMKDIDIDKVDSYKQTALMIAIEKANSAAVAMLLLAGADRTLCNEQKQTATDLARKAGHAHILNLLAAQSDEMLAKYLTEEEQYACRDMLRNSAVQNNSLSAALKTYRLFNDARFLQLFLKQTNLRKICSDNPKAQSPVDEFEARFGVSGGRSMDAILFGSKESPAIYDFLYGPDTAAQLKKQLGATLELATALHQKNLASELVAYRVPASQYVRRCMLADEAMVQGEKNRTKVIRDEDLAPAKLVFIPMHTEKDKQKLIAAFK